MTLIRPFLTTTLRDMRALPRQIARDRETLTVINLTLLPWLAHLLLKNDLNILLELASIGGFIAFYWLVARQRPFEYVQWRKPRWEMSLSLVVAGAWMLYRIGQYWKWYTVPEWNIGVCNDFSTTLIPKMFEMALVPFVILLALRYSLRAMGLRGTQWTWLAALVPGVTLIAQGLTKHPLDQFANSTACFYFGAGLPEEFLFRALLQTQLVSLLRRPLLAVWLASFVFGVTHLPINLHGAFDQWQDALLNAFTYQMGVGFALGYAYQRARNILPLSIVHALIDSAP